MHYTHVYGIQKITGRKAMENTAALTTDIKKPPKKKGVIRGYPKSLVMLFIMLFLCYVEYQYSTTYIDEGCAVIAFILIIFNITRITQRDIITLIILTVGIIIGIFGNIIFGLNDSWFSVGVDVLSQMKMPLAFFSVKYVLNSKEKQQTIDMMVPIAKLYLIVNSFLALISQIIPTPFALSERYGLKSYHFLFTFSQQYSTVTFIMLGAIVCCTNMPEKKRRFYIVLGCIAAVASLKSFSIIFTAVFIALTFFYKRYSTINIKFIIPMVIFLVLLSSYQIDAYLTNENSPRRVFIDYAIIDANQHFPLGSGFGTFGSSEAAKHYSPLYYQYGFTVRWGMSPDNPKYLVDTYWPTVIGQLGYFGGIAFITMYVRIFLSLNYSKLESNRRAFLYAMFAQYMVHALGSAILQSSTGFLGFMMMSLCTVVDEEKENKGQKIKIHIET